MEKAHGPPTRRNCVQIVMSRRGLTSIPLDLRGLSSGPQRRKLSGESNNDARLPDTRPRAYNPKVAGSNPAPATLFSGAVESSSPRETVRLKAPVAW